jgi:MHS family proline/betaine transporter-like MFS transporter
MIALLPGLGRLSDRIGRRPLMLGSCLAFIVLGVPFFMMASSGNLALTIFAQLLMMVLYAPYATTCASFLTEITPNRVRYTSMSVGYNIAVAIFGGFAPFIATWLVRETGSPYAPAAYLIASAVITGIVVLRTRETAFTPLS